MKTIKWVGSSLLATAAAIAAILLIGQPGEAAPGDAVERRARGDVTLTAPQRTCLRNWMSANMPASIPAQLDALECGHDNDASARRVCATYDLVTLTDAQYVALEARGRLPRPAMPSEIAADGRSVTMRLHVETVFPDASQAASIDTCVGSIFSAGEYAGVTPTAVHSFTVRKVGAGFVGSARTLGTKPPTQRLLSIRNGTADELVGVVGGTQ